MGSFFHLGLHYGLGAPFRTNYEGSGGKDDTRGFHSPGALTIFLGAVDYVIGHTSRDGATVPTVIR